MVFFHDELGCICTVQEVRGARAAELDTSWNEATGSKEYDNEMVSQRCCMYDLPIHVI